VGTGKYTYELIQDLPKHPPGESLGIVSTVATDSQDRMYVFQRQDPPVMVFDRRDNYLIRDGNGAVLARWAIRHAHGLWVDSHGDLYLGLTTSHSVDKYVRVN
jgi:hypothetical protein